MDTGKDTRRLVNEVMRRFIDLGMIRGGKTGKESPVDKLLNEKEVSTIK